MDSGYMELHADYWSAVFFNGFDGPIITSTFFEGTKSRQVLQYATLNCEGVGFFIFHPDSEQDRDLEAGVRLWCMRLFAGNDTRQSRLGIAPRSRR